VQKKSTQRLNTAQILNDLRDGGSVALRLEHFEPRQAQLDLMELIIRCFNEDAIGAAEAGTGVGKSFAYLLPAMQFAQATGERVVVSTATITLQQQLFGKDIPLVLNATSAKIKAALVKGRGNYLCRRRLDDALREPDLAGSDEQEQLDSIARWAETSKFGGKDELSFAPAEAVWSRVCSDADVCMGKQCPLQSCCCITVVRKEAAAARIVVVNHHLLFADLAIKQSGAGLAVLPPYSRVIIDEAHTIENAATSFFSKEFSKLGILRQAGRLYRKRRRLRRGSAGNSSAAGLLVRLCSLLPNNDKRLEALSALLDDIRKAAEELDRAALELCGIEGVFRFSPERENKGAEIALFPMLSSLEKKLNAFTENVRGLFDLLPEDVAEDAAVWETRAVLRRFEDIAGICTAFTGYRERHNDVMWIERRGATGGEPWTVFTKSPVDLADSLNKSLFSPNKTVVCVSATLAVNGNFSYWATRCGASCGTDNVNNRPLFTGCFPSPFPYANAVLLGVPADASLPDEPNYQDFINRAVGDLASIAGGSALVLFTSYLSLRSAWDAARPVLEELGIRCLRQGDDDRSRLLQTFLSDTNSVLFATDSFWEGVDAPGDTLRMVIICRLPFRTPNDPVFEARCEALEKMGGNAFMDISLPGAVMKFKQGFGRLMRRSSDRGVVVVLDGRLIAKKYGALFLHALPETRTSFSGFSGMLRDVENFLFPA